MTNRFDLEDAIMAAWQTENDLELFLERHIDGEKMSSDDVDNVILGLAKIHAMRMEKLWSVFKQVHHLDNYSHFNNVDVSEGIEVKPFDSKTQQIMKYVMLWVQDKIPKYQLEKHIDEIVSGAEKCSERTKEGAEKCDEWLEDGFGSIWRKCNKEDCGKFVVRPGKVDCYNGDCPEENTNG
jgi:hypothetical protein